MKNNYAMKHARPDSWAEDDARWVNLPPLCDSMQDPEKVLTAEKLAAMKAQEDEAYQRFLKNRNRVKPTATGVKE
jgi:hypothetical protein